MNSKADKAFALKTVLAPFSLLILQKFVLVVAMLVIVAR